MDGDKRPNRNMIEAGRRLKKSLGRGYWSNRLETALGDGFHKFMFTASVVMPVATTLALSLPSQHGDWPKWFSAGSAVVSAVLMWIRWPDRIHIARKGWIGYYDIRARARLKLDEELDADTYAANYEAILSDLVALEHELARSQQIADEAEMTRKAQQT